MSKTKEPKRNVYVGHRYVPKIMGDWDKEETYEGLSIVVYEGKSYTSKKRVPKGIDILNDEYWVITGNYNAQVDQYRQEAENVLQEIDRLDEEVKNNLQSNKDYMNNLSNTLTEALSDKPDVYQINPDESIDDFSSIFNNAFQNHDNIIIKNGYYEVDVSKMLPLKSDTMINFEPNAKIKVLPNDLERYELLNIKDVQNVIINNPQLEGDKHEHSGNTGQWGHGINIDGGENIVINNPICNQFWGDGIYIKNAKNLKIIDAYCDDNRRQGMSLISGENVDIVRPVCVNTGGQNPGAGIDIEPNFNEDHLININIYDPYLKNNGNPTSYDYGFVISLANRGSIHRKVDINIYNAKIPVGAIVISADELNNGEVNIIEPVIENSENAGMLITNKSEHLQLNIIRPKIIKPNRLARESIYVAGIKIQNEVLGDELYTGIQNIKIVEPEIITDNIKTFAIRITDVNDQLENNLKNVEIIRPKTVGFNDVFRIDRGSNSVIKPAKSLKLEYGRELEKTVINSFGSGIGSNLNRLNIVYQGNLESMDYGIIPIFESLPVTDVEITIENNLSKPLEVRFTNNSSDDYSPKKAYPLSNDELNAIRLPHKYSWVKMVKISETEFKIINSSRDIEPIDIT